MTSHNYYVDYLVENVKRALLSCLKYEGVVTITVRSLGTVMPARANRALTYLTQSN